MNDRTSSRPRSARGPAPSVRAVAARLVDQALAALVPVDTLLAHAGKRFDERDRRLLAELVYGVLRWLRRLDHAIELAAERPLERIDPPLRAPLRIAALQLFTLDRVPAHAAVSEAVDDARRRGGRGAAGFANAVLRRLARAPRWDAWPVATADPVTRLAVEASHPERLVRRWWRQYGEARTRGVVAANNGPRAPHLLAFADHGGRGALAEALAGENVSTAPSALSPVGLVVADGQPLATRAFARGDFYVQDAASQAAALVPPPRAGERVLDAAAAPGGKGLAVLAAEPAARVVYADASLSRLRRLDENLHRLGRPASRVVAVAQAPPWRAAFDRIVLDAPCTGTGTLRRHPELRWRFSTAALARLAGDSERMLRALAAALRPGGLLILATCSIEPEENEAVVDRVLAAEPALRRRALIEAAIPPDDVGDREAGLWRVLPSREHDGFSVHVLARRS